MKHIFHFSFFIFSFFAFSCSFNNVTEDSRLEKYFDSSKAEGCFAIYNNGTNEFTVHNLGRYRDSSYTPASTFKIVNSLIALHTGKIFDENEVIQWDGIKRWNDDWNKDMNMKEACKVSNIAYYQEVARRIGRDTMKLWIDSISYGNKNISGPIDSFWLNNHLKIKPDEELGLVKRLYFHQLPFNERAQRIVCNMMLREDNVNYRLSYKTGWGFRENRNALGWTVGWIEENKHVYFFVLNIESVNHDFDIYSAREKILKGILNELGFMQGKK
jgi:beta-lactamase class D